MVKCDFYENVSGKSKRIAIPYNALQWLIENLDKQGSFQAELEQLPDQSQLNVLNDLGENFEEFADTGELGTQRLPGPESGYESGRIGPGSDFGI